VLLCRRWDEHIRGRRREWLDDLASVTDADTAMAAWTRFFSDPRI
jgi:hypothetical protein